LQSEVIDVEVFIASPLEAFKRRAVGMRIELVPDPITVREAFAEMEYQLTVYPERLLAIERIDRDVALNHMFDTYPLTTHKLTRGSDRKTFPQ